jgi:glycosyltransferase involved in cell wall biosynthesis
MKKMLMLASVASMIDQFNMANIAILQKQGYEVHVAANFEQGNTSSRQRGEDFKQELEEQGIRYYQVDFARDVTKILTNFMAYYQIKALMAANKYQFVHCHSPIGGVWGRLAGHSTQTKIIYTAHGFHFFKGAPLQNWLLYYPIERWLAKYTDVLITINKEDYVRAEAFKARKVVYVSGVGLDTKKFGKSAVEKKEKRKELGIPDEAQVLLAVGELNKNKNHETIIKALKQLDKSDVFLLICGRGPLEKYLKDLARSLNLSNQVRLLGYRTDIAEIYKAADLFVFPSFREGLSVALMEAMAAGLAIVCSDIRGNRDLIVNGKGGCLVKPEDPNKFANNIIKLLKCSEVRVAMAAYNQEVVKSLSSSVITAKMREIFSSLED